jgi:hypothetical protein
MRLYMVFLSFVNEAPGYYVKLGHGHFLFSSLRITYPVIRLSIVHDTDSDSK